jgi:pimeloyl-ACP methyl ester carboxylesterase
LMARFDTFDGASLHFEVRGEGPPVVLLHGFAADSERNWFAPGIADALQEAGRRVIALDARGHGLSEKPHDPSAYAGGAMIRDVQCLLEHLGVEEVDVCGYSMGAMTTYAFAGRDERVRSAVLGGFGGGSGRWGSMRDRGARISAGLLADDKSSIGDPLARAFRAFADATGADRVALAAIQQSRSSASASADLRPLTVPTLVIAGADDALVGSEQELEERFPGAEVKVVAGNHLTAVLDPSFGAEIVEFLDRVDARSGKA